MSQVKAPKNSKLPFFNLFPLTFNHYHLPPANPSSLSKLSTNMMPPPLPPNPYVASTQFVFNRAYEKCLSLEGRHDQVLQSGNMQVLVCARFLGRMILEAPEDEGREDFASEVKRCVGDEELQSLAEVYTNHLLCICKCQLLVAVAVFLTMKRRTHSLYKPRSSGHF